MRVSMHRVVHGLSIAHIVGSKLHCTSVHIFQLLCIRGFCWYRVTINLDVGDILFPSKALTRDAANILTTRTFEENKDNHANKNNKGEHWGPNKDIESCIVTFSFDVSNVRNASIGYHYHLWIVRFDCCHGRWRGSVSLVRDTWVNCYATFIWGDRGNCNFFALGFVTRHRRYLSWVSVCCDSSCRGYTVIRIFSFTCGRGSCGRCFSCSQRGGERTTGSSISSRWRINKFARGRDEISISYRAVCLTRGTKAF